MGWSEIESGLQEISKPNRAGDRPVERSLPLEPSVPLAHGPTLADETPVTSDQPLSISNNPLDILSCPGDGAISLSPHQDILTKFQHAIAVSTSTNRLSR